MADIIKTGDHQLVQLIHDGGNGLTLKKPFEEEIFLFDTYVAGTTHVVGIEDIAPTLDPGDKLNLYREADNPYDEMAILVMTEHDIKLGYVPRKDNVVFARLMDAGKFLFGRVVNVEFRGEWARIRFNIFMSE